MANVEIKCPCCGGALSYDQSKNMVTCPYCDSEFTAEDLKQYTDDLAEDAPEDTRWDDSNISEFSEEEGKNIAVYSCDSCGGEILCEATTSSTSCPYCGNNVLVSSRISGDLRPNYVIPFKKNKDEAQASLKKFMRKKLLLPMSFSKKQTIEEIKSLYVPFWIFDADVDGKVRFKGEKHRTWSDSNYTYRETKYYSLVRGGHIAFDHVPVDGSKKMQDELMESIEPFDFKEAEKFQAGYLAGYAADRYDVSKDETYGRATTRFREGTIDSFRQDIHGYSDVHVTDSNLQLSKTSSAYALYPVWILNTKWKDKPYQFAVNGQTGKIAGNLPVSPLKFAFWATLFTLVFGALAELIFLACTDFEFDPTFIIVSAMIGIAISVILMIVLWRKNKNVRFVHGASSYIRENSLHITTRRDIFLYRKVTKTRKSSSSNSSAKRR